MKLGRGIHEGVEMARYHGDLCEGPSVSGSGLARLEATTPAHFYADWYGNPDAAPRETTPAMAFGTAFHKYALEGFAAFEAEYVIKPADLDGRTKEGRAWKAANGNRPYVTTDELETIQAMTRAFRAKPKTAALMANARPEVTLIDQIGGVWVKGRPDAMNDKLRVAVNLKTCEDASEEAVRKAIDAYAGSYYVSAALTLDLLMGLTGQNWAYVFVFIEKRAPYESRRVTLKPTVIEWGRLRYHRALTTFAECVKAGHWPGYADETIEADLPPWAEKALQARHEAGEFTQEAAE
ncbi:MAG: PD-(D/E)XK nuclease-like domain-containing protein [Methylobacterium sp.]|nr:PD-(D/E)XK nuclease-like domain-containing protein [Methylobacterium sp.]